MQSIDAVAADSLDYSRKIRSGSTYIMKNTQPSEGSWASWALSATTENNFDLPPVVMNLSKSVFTGLIEVAAADVTAGAVNGLFKLHNGMVTPILNIALLSKNTSILVADVKDVPQYTKILMPATTELSDFLTNSSFYLQPRNVAHADADAHKVAALAQPGQFFNKTNCSGRKQIAVSTAGVSNAAGAVVDEDGDRIFAKGAFYFAADNCQTYGLSQVPVIDWATCAGGTNTTVSTVNATNFYFAYQLPLSQIPDSIFNYDKDLYFGETMTLRVTWNQSINVGYVHTQNAINIPASTSTGGGVEVTEGTDVEGKFSGIANLGAAGAAHLNPKFWLAVVKDPIISGAVKAQVRSQGMKLLIPYPIRKKVPLAIAGENTAQMDISSALGKNLLRVWSTVCLSTSELGYRLAHNVNVGGLHYKYLQSSLNGDQLQDSAMSVAGAEDYLFLRRTLDKSVIQQPQQYYRNAFWVDDWTGVKSVEFKDVNDVDCGIALSAEPLLYQVKVTTATVTNNLYMFAIVQKVLSIGPEGITVSSK